MTFTITLVNDGVDGTIDVNEKVNENENKQVFTGFVGAGDTQLVNCLGTGPKDFTWLHHASNLSGGPERVDAGGTLRANS